MRNPSPVVDKPAPYDIAVEGRYSPTGLPTTGCCSLYNLVVCHRPICATLILSILASGTSAGISGPETRAAPRWCEPA